MRIGYVIDNYLPGFSRAGIRHAGWKALWRGHAGCSAMGMMRYGWIAESIREQTRDIEIELYRPWRTYDLVVFLKSQSAACRHLQTTLCGQGVRTVYDINVNYFQAAGTSYYEGMLPTAEQQQAAIGMARAVDHVITASSFIREAAAPYCRNVTFIPDNVKSSALSAPYDASPLRSDKLQLLWCGQPAKLFELLAVEDALCECRDIIQLTLVTGDLQNVKDRWNDDLYERYTRMMDVVKPEYMSYQNIPHLWDVCARSGVVISPRFLDNSYNQGHSEWKLTLSMAAGCPGIGSPQQSYVELCQKAGGYGMHICRNNQEWISLIRDMQTQQMDSARECRAAATVVRDCYDSAILARQYMEVFEGLRTR